jgi:hypothetical protein
MFLSSASSGDNPPMNQVNPLNNSSFRKLFAAQVIALVGTGLSTVALTLLAYDMVGGNAAAVLGTALVIIRP